MFARFSDRARKVMALANQEAQRFQHQYIGSEHILLGLIKEGTGVGANVLKCRDVDLKKVRVEVEKFIRPGPGSGGGKLPQTPRAKKVIELAVEESKRLGHNYVGTEHLLLGLLREGDGVAAQVLINLGLRLEEVRREILALLGAGPASQRESDSPLAAVAEGPSKDAALVRMYRDLIEGWGRQMEEYVVGAEFELAADAREQRNRLEDLLSRLVKRLADDPRFGEAVLPDNRAPEEP